LFAGPVSADSSLALQLPAHGNRSTSSNHPNVATVGNEIPKVDLADEDILGAMQRISGYLDITTGDVRAIYHLAHRHALERMFGDFMAGTLMRTGVAPLLPGMHLDDAARALVRSGLKSLPVVDENGCVIGVLSEADFLRRFNAGTFFELLLGMLDDSFEFSHRCHEAQVSEAMSTPAVSVAQDAGCGEVIHAFHQHDGPSTPIVDRDGRLLGMLLREDFFAALNAASTRKYPAHP
jgi:CBS-domain-containing membrane protein